MKQKTFKPIDIWQLISILNDMDHAALHIHHTWKPRHEDFDGHNHQQLQYGMWNYHVNHLGWSDIAQHVTLFPDGQILTGRPFFRNPASAVGYNEGAFMVEIIGNFDREHDRLEGMQLKNAIRLSRCFYNRDLPIIFHREMTDKKTCPGDGITKKWWMDQVINMT